MPIINEKVLEILKNLHDEPTHGYQLYDDIDEISKGHVYQHLKELREAGLSEIHEEETEGLQRKSYRLTENGEMLLEALGELE